MSEKYYSNASWSKIPNSQDEHDSYEYANAICIRLEDEYMDRPCSIRGLCTSTWVSDENGNEIK
jgi:hypothetical protein